MCSNPAMPVSWQAFTLPRTYTSLAGSLPTRISASPGFSCALASMSFTASATSARTLAAIAFPSMIIWLFGLVAAGFDVVAVGVDDEGAVERRVIGLARSRSAVVLG